MEKASIQLGLELRVLTSVEAQFIGVIKELSAELHEMLSAMGESREQEQATIRLDLPPETSLSLM